VVMYDHVTHRSRGFGFVTFEDASVCSYLLSMGHEANATEQSVGRIQMRGKTVEIKSAEPKAAIRARASGSNYASTHNNRSLFTQGRSPTDMTRSNRSNFSSNPYPSQCNNNTNFYPPTNDYYNPYHYFQCNNYAPEAMMYYYPQQQYPQQQQPPTEYGYVPAFIPEGFNDGVYQYPQYPPPPPFGH
jgi:hypothetical protein